MREWIAYLMERFWMSERKACETVEKSDKITGISVRRKRTEKSGSIAESGTTTPAPGFKKMNAVLQKRENG